MKRIELLVTVNTICEGKIEQLNAFTLSNTQPEDYSEKLGMIVLSVLSALDEIKE